MKINVLLFMLFLSPALLLAQFGNKFEFKFVDNSPMTATLSSLVRMYEIPTSGSDQVLDLYLADPTRFKANQRDLAIYLQGTDEHLQIIPLDKIGEQQMRAVFHLAQMLPSNLHQQKFELKERFRKEDEFLTNTLFVFTVKE